MQVIAVQGYKQYKQNKNVIEVDKGVIIFFTGSWGHLFWCVGDQIFFGVVKGGAEFLASNLRPKFFLIGIVTIKKDTVRQLNVISPNSVRLEHSQYLIAQLA